MQIRQGTGSNELETSLASDSLGSDSLASDSLGSGSPRAQSLYSPRAEENPRPNLQGADISPRLWLAILVTGIGAGLAGGMLMRLLRLVQHLCFHYVSGDFLTGVEGVSGMRRFLVVACAGVLAALALLLIRRIPDRNGPGLNEAIWNHDGLLPQQSMSARAVLSVVIVGMGAALGREAALKDGGGIVGLRVSRWFGLNPPQRKLLVACGVGAGMSAAYNVPLGGALFILEVLLGTVSVETAIAAFSACFIATAVSWLLLPNEPTYQIPYLPVNLSLSIFALLSGPLMGIAAVLFVRGIHWAKNHKPKGAMAVILPVVVFSALGAAAIEWPAMLGNGKNVIQLAFDSRLAGSVLFVLLVLRPLATIACLRAGAPGGLFTPTMTLGAMLGAAMGEGWSHLWTGADKRSCALLGAGAVLAAATQAPISSLAFALELTYSMSSLIVPLLLAVSGAVLTYRRFESRTSY